jgi:eukaryotic-like serine/threonine-protein kinase
MSEPDQREEVVFEAALSLPSEQRAAYLDKACAGDLALRRRVESLLGAHARAGSFLKEPAVARAANDIVPALSPTEKPGDKIGRYKLLQQIGEGGCGVVYMAEQEEPVRRRVALKVIKLGMDTKNVIARFEAERQALAMMDHVNIAQVFDAGATETGRPFFVMELVRGIAITKYCDQNNLSTEERLKLFVQVCRAIQHAHQKGVIHRDIKPSNILITVNDGVPVPKVIDFGIAKATQGRLTDHTLFTAFEQFIGTPAYMSPEQAAMTSLDIDTRSDIYSLGVLLYELLTGQTPFDAKEMLAAGLEEMRRTIREREPLRPSTRLNTMGVADLTTAAQRRQVEAPKLVHLVRGDLDWVVMKCMEKDRARRYETVNGLAADIQRHLNNEPVVARPPSAADRFQKLVRRNKAAFTAATIVVVILLVGVAVSTWEAIRATRAEREQIRLRQQAEAHEKKAKTEAARSAQTAQFLKDTLRAAGPGVARGRDATLLKEILEKTAQRVEKELKAQPEVQGDLWFTLGATYHDIGDFPKAITNYQRAVDSYRLAFADPNTKLALALVYLGARQSFAHNVTAGRTTAQMGLDMARKCGDPETLARCLFWMARSLDEGGISETDPYGASLMREAVELRKQLGNDPVALASCMTHLASYLGDEESAEGESLQREALALTRRQFGPDDPRVLDELNSLGQTLMKRRKLAEAEAIFREAVDLSRRIYDRKNWMVPMVERFLVQTLALEGKGDEAEAIIRKEIEAFPSDYKAWQLRGRYEAYRGNWSAAIEPFSRSLELEPNDETGRHNLAIVLLQAGQLEEYRRQCHQHLERFGKSGEVSYSTWAANISLLLPVGGVDFERACELADFVAIASEPKRFVPWARLSKALADYRRGRFESANDWGNRALSADNVSESCRAAAKFIQALAYARLGQMDSARTSFSQGNEIIRQPRAEVSQEFGGDWPYWSIAELLGCEAGGLLGVYRAEVTDRPRQALTEVQPAAATKESE